MNLKPTAETLAKRIEEGALTVREAGEELNLKDEEIRFAIAYNRDYQGDGLQCVFDIYGLDEREDEDKVKAKLIAKRLLNDPDVLTLINAQLSAAGLNDSHADSQLLFLINQHHDKKAKLAAIKEYHAITERVKRQEREAARSIFDYTRLTTTELRDLVELLNKCRVDNGTHPIPIVSFETNNVQDV